MKMTASCVLLAVFLMILPIIVFAGEINLPKTGKTTCYDEDGAVINCAGTGQDGDIQAGVEWPSPRFTDNNDGTVTDNLTGLMWLKDANCLGEQSWQVALDVVADFNTNPATYNCSDYTANYNDWKLPNAIELESLVNAETPSSAIWLNTQGFTNVQSTYYWSATTCAYDSYRAWRVYMSYGYMTSYGKSIRTYIWPVRAGQ
jgi:hypothetical protein